MKIVLPLPPKELHPNARPHWAQKAKATKKYRSDAKWATLYAMDISETNGEWPTATVKATFYVKTNHKRDADNMLASLKAAMDGLADAGLIVNDSGLTHLPVEIVTGSKYQRVELEVVDSTNRVPVVGK